VRGKKAIGERGEERGATQRTRRRMVLNGDEYREFNCVLYTCDYVDLSTFDHSRSRCVCACA